ncbi:cysteine ABC transporter permease [Sporomusaceae bacterium FL31]|nr:cysteine ABC transporter permease [Sporomusaceae bacterium FL31]GCE32962.1 cysteine ABC transporter permease [Sporomusaceae bacterium]
MLVSREWGIVFDSFPVLLQGTFVTVYLSVLAMVGAVIVGLLVAVVRVANIKGLTQLAQLYVSFFRGTPLLVQLLMLYFGLTSFNIILDPFPAALIGLILHFGAYISEIFRATIISISTGQWEAALSLGMTYSQALRRIVLPQAARIAIPPLWNCLIDVLKSSSLASVVTVPELTRQVEEQSSAQFVFMPYFVTLALFYWVLVLVMGLVQEWLERKLRIPGGSS